MGWIEPRIGIGHIVYVHNDEGDVSPRIMIARKGSTDIEIGWYPISEKVYREAVSLKDPGEIDRYAEILLERRKHEARMVA